VVVMAAQCSLWALVKSFFFFFQAEDGIRDFHVTGVQTCALPILPGDQPGDCAICLLSLTPIVVALSRVRCSHIPAAAKAANAMFTQKCCPQLRLLNSLPQAQGTYPNGPVAA